MPLEVPHDVAEPGPFWTEPQPPVWVQDEITALSPWPTVDDFTIPAFNPDDEPIGHQLQVDVLAASPAPGAGVLAAVGGRHWRVVKASRPRRERVVFHTLAADARTRTPNPTNGRNR